MIDNTMIDELRYEIEQLKAEVQQLREQLRDSGVEPRLGPRPQSDEEVQARIDKFVEKVRAATPILPVDRSALCTTNGKTPEEVRAAQKNETGQHDGYIVLCEEERAKGFQRPYRDAYKHVGPLVPKSQVCVCRHAPHETGRCPRCECGVFAPLAIDDGVPVRTPGCGTVTTMGRSLSETYARDPGFYGATFCVGCNQHLPVNEFVWTTDGQEVGS